MTIPSASFLHQIYQNQRAVEVLARMESMHLLSLICSALRNPDKHKLGTIKYFFSKEQFPHLNSQKATPLLLDVINKFVAAGYHADYCYENNGFVISLDWTKEPAPRMMWASTSHSSGIGAGRTAEK